MTRRPRGRPRHDDVLTPAEWRVVEAVRHGLTNPAIAKWQGISLDAVKFHVSNSLVKLGFCSRLELRHWDGIRRDSVLWSGRTRVIQPLKCGKVGQVSRTVADIEEAQRWYRDVLGLRHLYTFGKLAFFDMDGIRLFLSEGIERPAESIIYFLVPDIHQAHAELTGRGANFSSAPHLIHRHENGVEEWMAFFDDNEGRPLAIMAQVAGAHESSNGEPE